MANKTTSDGLSREIIDLAMEKYIAQLERKVKKIVRPYQ